MNIIAIVAAVVAVFVAVGTALWYMQPGKGP